MRHYKNFSSHLFCFALAIVFSFSLIKPLAAQNSLLPSIGLTALPADGDSVCYIPFRIVTSFDTLGYKLNEPVADFTLYTLDGEGVNLNTLVESGKPTLLITCSYTCYVFRSMVPKIDSLQAMFGDQVNIYLVYTVEVHPWHDTSIYFGFVNPSSFNILDDVLYDQPKTYGERKSIVGDMLAEMQIDVPVLIDGPCNNFWMNYECGPNTAYLLDTNGVIYSKHGWFDLYPADMEASIKNILGITNIENNGATGHFSFEMNDEDSIIFAIPETTILFHGSLVNNDTSSAIVEMIRKQELIPSKWFSAICAGICYPPVVDSATVNLLKGTSIDFMLDMFTAKEPDTGIVQMLFRNQSYPNEVYSQWFIGITGLPVNVLESTFDDVLIYPNPVNDNCYLLTPQQPAPDSYIRIYNASGKLEREFAWENAIHQFSVAQLPAGIYVLKAVTPSYTFQRKIIVSN